eukprot:CAMPEP_0195584120 /NCGR_PEP_ID=MMETSP0814-20130614/25348_1 /TAXON_ID=97485 /ORGANISM="Prymnesium parvum, Strain Texoma1" /LENGTH=92 /DNA_ID=CAMNT_0040722103 /DNA_START=118 /DNA_END=392 /DNA_ORIENTATION=+
MRYGVSFATPSGACAVSACSSCGVSSELIAPTTSHTAIEQSAEPETSCADSCENPTLHTVPVCTRSLRRRHPELNLQTRTALSEPPEASNWP